MCLFHYTLQYSSTQYIITRQIKFKNIKKDNNYQKLIANNYSDSKTIQKLPLERKTYLLDKKLLLLHIIHILLKISI